MIYPIVAYGDPVLRKRAEEIEENQLDKKLIADMFDTMYSAQGVGLAAPQIGVSKRLFIVDGESMEEDELIGFKKVFINPEKISEQGQAWAFEEGCLSIPTIRENVMRAAQVRIRYRDENWKLHEEDFDGLKARIIQHEYDHLEGVLFTDHLSQIKKQLLRTKLRNISRGNVKADYRMKFVR